jgi:hypothetical protein
MLIFAAQGKPWSAPDIVGVSATYPRLAQSRERRFETTVDVRQMSSRERKLAVI